MRANQVLAYVLTTFGTAVLVISLLFVPTNASLAQTNGAGCVSNSACNNGCNAEDPADCNAAGNDCKQVSDMTDCGKCDCKMFGKKCKCSL